MRKRKKKIIQSPTHSAPYIPQQNLENEQNITTKDGISHFVRYFRFLYVV